MYLQVRKNTNGVTETGSLMRSLAVAYSGDVAPYMSMSVPAFYRKVRDVPYRSDPKEMEFLQRPAQTLAGRGPGGDCDDKAIAMAAFLHRKEIPFRFIGAARYKESPLHHTWVQGYINGEWVDFDTTYAWNSAGSRVGSWEKEVVINKENNMMVGVLYGDELLGRAGFLRRATRKAMKTYKKVSPAHIAFRVARRTVKGVGHGIASAGRGTGHILGNVGRGGGKFLLRAAKIAAPVATAFFSKPQGYTGGPDTGLLSQLQKATSPDVLPPSITQPDRTEVQRAGMSLPLVLGIVGVGVVGMMMLKKKR